MTDAVPSPTADDELLLLVDPTTLRIALSNAAVERVLGYSATALSELSITDIETALQGFFYWEDIRAGRIHPVAHQEDLYRCADGRLLPVTRSVSLLGAEGHQQLLVRASPDSDAQPVRDALAQTLSRLRATLESTGNGILVLEWEGRVGSMNRRFGELWNLPAELLQARDDEGVLSFLVDSVVEADLLRDRLTRMADPTPSEDTVHHRDGRVFTLGSRPQYLDGRIVGRVFSVADVTQQTRDAEALRRARDELEQRVNERTADLSALNETLHREKERLALTVHELEATQAQLMQSERMASIGQLAAGVAHEINNPVGFVHSNLGSLKLYIERLLTLIDTYETAEPQLPADWQTRLADSRQATDLDFLRQDIGDLLTESLDGLQRVTRIVQDLKNFSHPDHAESELADIEQGLESTLRVVWNELKYKCEVVRQYAGVPQVMCRPFQLNQVFMNLLVNASQAIEQRGTVTVRTRFDDDWIWVDVEDTGKGISPENLQRIFDPFFTTKPVGKGTGLGLSLAYGIVHKHGGRIDVRSRLGQGSVFTVSLPRHPVAVADAAG